MISMLPANAAAQVEGAAGMSGAGSPGGTGPALTGPPARARSQT